jgi:hypothetical protein
MFGKALLSTASLKSGKWDQSFFLINWSDGRVLRQMSGIYHLSDNKVNKGHNTTQKVIKKFRIFF